MTAEQNSFHRWSGSPTICYDTNAIWEISVIVAHGGGPAVRSLRGGAAVAAGRGRSRCTKTKQQKNTLVPALSRPLGGAEAKGADAPAR